MERIYQCVDNKREDDEISIGSQDSYSQSSLVSEQDMYQEDSFLEIKKENLKTRKNLNRDCCRKTLDNHQDFLLMKLNEEKIEQTKLEKKLESKIKDCEIDRNKKNHEILHEINKCKAAIYKLSRRKWKIHLSYNDKLREFDKNGLKENGLVHDRKEPLKTYESDRENKEENIYKCTYCGNWKADNWEYNEREDSVTKCVYCGNLSFEKTNAEMENMMNNNIM